MWGESFGWPKHGMRGVVRGRGYYVRRIILGEEKCEVGDRVGNVDMTGRVCYGK